MSTSNSLTLYATANPITITLTALGTNAARESTTISNLVNGFADAMVYMSMKMGWVSTTQSDNAIYVYAAGSDGNIFPSVDTSGTKLTGVDAAANTTPSQIALLRVFSLAGLTANTVNLYIPSVAVGFGGTLPSYWNIVVDNHAVAFNGTAGTANFTCNYIGMYNQASY